MKPLIGPGSSGWISSIRNIPPRLAWIAEAWATEFKIEPEVRAIGFLVAQNGGPEWELENIAVLPEFRRKGVACGLLSALLAQARSLRAERILLEVRASNHAAIRLYHASGFQSLARRREYYRNPPEDAIILQYHSRIKFRFRLPVPLPRC